MNKLGFSEEAGITALAPSVRELARACERLRGENQIAMSNYQNDEMLSRARTLRKNMTPQEIKLWYVFLRTYPVKFYKQRIIGPYIADFYCASAKLVIEIDGSQHYEQAEQEYDRKRNQYMEEQDLMVLRFSNREINLSFSSVCEAIDLTVKKRLTECEKD